MYPDLVSSLADFKKRIKAYESACVPFENFRGGNDMQYLKTIDPGH